jgi:Tfp pilus assembly protein PilF
VHAHKNLGDVAYRKSQHEEAAEHYRRAISIDPDFGDDVYAKLANIHYKKKEREEAVKYWTRALEINPDNRVVRNNLEIVATASADA